ALFGLPGQDLGNSVAAILIGMVYDYLPFMLLPIYNAVSSVPSGVLEAARDLGSNPLHVFVRIMLPLTLPGIESGIIMVFIPALTTFAISDVLGGGKVMLIGNVIEQEFLTSLNWHLGSGLSFILMIFVLIGMVFSMKGEK
ncbi:MAG: ABC transporter permease, partial [Lachnospiraceae bacterium]|nr:ABC transporter permease [Lachnospiraceae bacterium]